LTENPRSPPTLNDVAALAGVSAQTVSNYLTGRNKPRSANLQRLEAAIKELGYRPSAAARALRLKRSNTIAMLLEDGADSAVEKARQNWEPLHAMFLYGATMKARELGYRITIVLTEQGTTEAEAQRLVREGMTDALICSTEAMPDAQLLRLQKLARTENVPIAMLQEYRVHPDICTVAAEDEHGATMAAEHFAALGHKRVAVMIVLPLWPGPIRRRDGFEIAARRLGLEVQVWECERYDAETIRTYAANRLQCEDSPTAVFAVNDIIAISVMKQAIDMGLEVGRDISIVGFNDLDIASQVTPPLTTIRTPAAAMGARAVEVLTNALGGQPLPKSTTLPVEFIIRGSSGPPGKTSRLKAAPYPRRGIP